MIHFQKEIAQLKIGTLGPFKHTSKVTRTHAFRQESESRIN